MRTITPLGWSTISHGFRPFEPPIGDPVEFWGWSAKQGAAFQLAAYFILATADACEDDFAGYAKKVWRKTRRDASPLRLARALDDWRRAMVIQFLDEPSAMVQ